jgi:ADP-ribose pyrophosphatase YjhB (NUDIX family)
MRVLSLLLHQVRRVWWSMARPITVGVRVFLVQECQVLLVRHTYHDAWYLPGGGVERGETLEQAIRREAKEEIGAALGELELFGVYSNFYEGKSDHVLVFVCRQFTLAGTTDHEIERYGFFDPRRPPDGLSPGTRRRMREYVEETSVCVDVW